MSYTPQAEVGKPASHPYGVSVMKKFLVSFTLPDGTAYTRTIEAFTAMLATTIAHAQITQETVLRDTVAIACTLQE
jgi:hypothetical protein